MRQRLHAWEQKQHQRQQQARKQHVHLRTASQLQPLALLQTAADGNGAEDSSTKQRGLSAGLVTDESPFDCVAFFNPTNFVEYEATVNGWADALLVLINSSTLTLAEAAVGLRG